MTDFPPVLTDAVSASRRKREPTKLEYGLLGALLASIALAFLLWVAIQFSLLNLIIQIR